MKKSILTLLLIGSVSTVFAQLNYFPATGNVGVGTPQPAFNLQIKGSTAFDMATVLAITNNAGDYGRANLVITGRVQDNNDAWQFGRSARNSIVFATNEAASQQKIGDIGDEKVSIQLEGNSSALGFLTKQNGVVPNMVMVQNGNIGIGTLNPTSKLAVKGLIRAQEVKVETANWPDFVFLREYKLPSLRETERYIQRHGHLENIPSALQVGAEGISLGDMNARLLQKIEELTLHLIALDKTNELKQKQVDHQQMQIDALRLELEKLIKVK